MFILLSQVEAGVGCPISMTYSVIPALRKQPELAERVGAALPVALLRRRAARPRAGQAGALCGMAMTEKQGGSDVRANTTVASPLNGGGPGAEYEITGHKWFCSAPMCDAFLVLAQADGGLSCFLLPRFTPDGERNRFHIQRLKDKLGNRSNASSEVEFRGAWARLVGEEGRGVPTIIDMVNHTRLDCVIGVSAGLRWGDRDGDPSRQPSLRVRQAAGRAAADAKRARRPRGRVRGGDDQRPVAGARLRRGPRRRRAGRGAAAAGDAGAQVLDLQARAGPRGRGAGVPGRQRLRRGVRDAPALPREPAGVDLGGIGQRPVSRRAAGDGRDPASVEAFFAEIDEARGANPHLDAAAAELREELADPEAIEARARRVVEWMALVLQGSLLVRYGDPAVADAFCASRLDGDCGRAFGTLPPGTDFERIIERHSPAF